MATGAQLSVTTAAVAYKSGILADNADAEDILSCVALEVIPPGRYVEILFSSGSYTCQLPKSVTTGLLNGGISLRQQMLEPAAGAAVGDIVAVLRKGRVWADCVAGMTEPTLFGQPANVAHSSTIATDRGKFSTAATSVVAGSELQAPTANNPTAFLKPVDAAGGTCLVEIK